MEFYLLNTALEVIAVIDTYTSAIWTTRYYTAGDFELYVPATEKMLNMLKQNYYLVKCDDTTQCMIIENIEIKTDVENGNYLIVTGNSLKSVLNRRIIWDQTVVNGNVETAIRGLVNANAINPTIAARKITGLMLGTAAGITGTMSAQYTGDNLGDIIAEICKTYKLGYDVLLDLDAKKFVFKLYKGADRSYNQTTNPHVVFSNEFENLLKTDYKLNVSKYKNVAKVAGEGEGAARTTVSIGTATGLNRYETFIDARDVSSNNGEITASDYTKLLIERGGEKLAEMTTTETIDGEVIANHTYKFNSDYFLGDVVEVINEYGLEMTPRITEVIESADTNGRTTIPKFSKD